MCGKLKGIIQKFCIKLMEDYSFKKNATICREARQGHYSLPGYHVETQNSRSKTTPSFWDDILSGALGIGFAWDQNHISLTHLHRDVSQGEEPTKIPWILGCN